MALEPPVRTVVIAATAIVALFAAFVALIWWGQEKILFQPPPFTGEVNVEGRVEYSAADGQRLAGYVVGNPRRSPGLLICFHGNADLSVWQREWAAEVVRQTGYAVFLAEYRGYLSLGGTPSYASTRLDSEAAWLHATSSLGVTPEAIALFGHSLGSGVATELAERHPPRVLLLQSPFSSARAMARVIVSRPTELAWNAVARIHFDTRTAVSKMDTPVFVIHGTRDRIVPVKLGLEVFQAAKNKGDLVIVEGAGHNDLPRVGGDSYWAWVRDALKP